MTCTYPLTGAEQAFTAVQIVAIGAAGGAGFYGPSDAAVSAPGGRGAEVRGTVMGLMTGDVLYVAPGFFITIGNPVPAFNGGGASGGA